MGFPSKEDAIVDLFFGEATKHWHFEEILKTSNLSRGKVNKWLQKLVKEGIINHIKPEGKMPYFIGNFDNSAYRNRKKLYTFSKLYRSGFLDHLVRLPGADTVIIFGSFSRADWYTDSDIDLFIYGSDAELDTVTYEDMLHHDIHVFTAKNQEELERIGPGLLRNIIEGTLVKGKINFVKVTPNATV